MDTEQKETPTPVAEPSTRVTTKRSDAEVARILKEAQERYKRSSDDDRDNIEAAREDVKFVYKAGAQWDEKVKERWGDDPVLEFPQLKQFVNQVVNDQRQSRPGVRVHPAGARASAQVAELLQGLARGIENSSQGEAVYDNGYQFCVTGGRGFWRIISEFENPQSFNQVLRLRSISDPSSVRMDLDFQEPDASDCNFYFVTESLQRETFLQRWPDAAPLSWQPSGEMAYWYDGKDTVIVADYYRRVAIRRTLVMLQSGEIGFLDTFEKRFGMKLPKEAILSERETDDYKVEWFKIAGGEQILEEYQWPGRTIPVVCDMGDNIIIDGKRVFQGLIRQARDAQRMYNYEKSLKALLISLYPLAPFIASDEATEGRENMWNNANKVRFSTLIYNGKDENGQPIPAPSRMQFGAVPSALTEMMASDKDDIKSIIGMYESSLGQRSQEVSGRAILAREKQGDSSTFHFADNHARAIALTGRIIIECAPTFYDTQRLVNIIKPDDTHEMVTLNQQGLVQGDGGALVAAIVKNDITTGEYAVTVESGPSYATAREQTRDYMMQLVQSNPQVMQLAGDIIVKSMDFPDSDELAERMQLMLPPMVQQHISMKDKGIKLPPQIAQQMGTMQQQLQGMQQAMQQLQQENQKLKAGELSKIETAKIGAGADANKASIDSETELQKAMLAAATQVALKMMEPVPECSPEVESVVSTTEESPNEPQALPVELPPVAPVNDSILALAQEVSEMARLIAKPRLNVFQTDANGEIVGSLSSIHEGPLQ